jgi:hypothetical protein
MLSLRLNSAKASEVFWLTLFSKSLICLESELSELFCLLEELLS